MTWQAALFFCTLATLFLGTMTYEMIHANWICASEEERYVKVVSEDDDDYEPE